MQKNINNFTKFNENGIMQPKFSYTRLEMDLLKATSLAPRATNRAMMTHNSDVFNNDRKSTRPEVQVCMFETGSDPGLDLELAEASTVSLQ